MTIPLAILALLAICVAALGVAWAVGVRIPAPVLGAAALSILLVAAVTLARIVAHDIGAR